MKKPDKPLPEWATWNEEIGRVEVDPAVVYPVYLEELGFEPSQNALECARRAVYQDLLKITGPGLHIYIAKNEDFKLSNYPEGPTLNTRAEYERICRERSKKKP